MVKGRALALLAGLFILGATIFTFADLVGRPSRQVAAAILATPTVTPSFTSEPEPTSTPTPQLTRTSKPTRTSPAPATFEPTRASVSSGQVRARPTVEHFLFGRPLSDDAPGPVPNGHYLYGTTEHGEYEVHHGVDFDNNPIGTSIFAVGDGTIVTAGDDRQPLCGDQGNAVCGRFRKFYGLVTVIRLDKTYEGQALFALYGHMNRIDVKVGQRVRAGDQIGTIGMTGIAIGPHVQFEIRQGSNDYRSTLNPMLWIGPLPGRGVLAGRYTNQRGNLIRAAVIDVHRADAPGVFYRETETYSRDEQPLVNSDEQLGENFLVNDLPAGEYVVRVVGKSYSVRVKISAGSLTFVEVGAPK